MISSRGSPIVRFGFAIGAFLCVISAPVSGYFLTRIYLEAKSSANWPATPGTLIKAQIGETSVGRYFADVAYSYHVGNTEYAGSRIRASDGEYSIRDGAAQAIHGLMVGKPIAVYYDPADPRRAVLQPGAGFQEYVLLLVPVGIFVFGLWALRLLWRTGGC